MNIDLGVLRVNISITARKVLPNHTSVNTIPITRFSGPSAKDELLRNYLSQKDGVILLHLEQSQWLLPLSVLLALVICAIVALVVHLTLENRRMLKNRSAKTARLQIALNLSILAQVSPSGFCNRAEGQV